MSFYSKLRCGNCGGIFSLYARDMSQTEPAMCPFCNMKFSPDQWRELVQCFRTLRMWNLISKSEAAEKGTPLFSAEIRRHYVPRDKVVCIDPEE